MAEDFRQRAVLRARGRLYEDFEVGQELVHHWGRTINYTEVLSKSDGTRADAGVVEFRHYGVNQRDELVAQVDRRALIKHGSYL